MRREIDCRATEKQNDLPSERKGRSISRPTAQSKREKKIDCVMQVNEACLRYGICRTLMHQTVVFCFCGEKVQQPDPVLRATCERSSSSRCGHYAEAGFARDQNWNCRMHVMENSRIRLPTSTPRGNFSRRTRRGITDPNGDRVTYENILGLFDRGSTWSGSLENRGFMRTRCRRTRQTCPRTANQHQNSSQGKGTISW